MENKEIDLIVERRIQILRKRWEECPPDKREDFLKIIATAVAAAQATAVLQPVLFKKQKAEWQVVDENLISWVLKVANGRKTMEDAFCEIKIKSRKTINFVPCENNGCKNVLHLGDNVLVTEWLNGTGKRIFCSIVCQRKNHVEMRFCEKTNFKLKTGKKTP